MGFQSLPRRRKGLLVTSALAILLTAAGMMVIILSQLSKDTYVPGGKVEGITSVLDRKGSPNAPTITFYDATETAGIDFRHFPWTRTSRLPEDMGSGVAWGDFDSDGWQDVYLPNIAGPLTMSDEELLASQAHNVLYRNTADGRFEDVSSQAGVDLRCRCSGASWADYDRDGHLDLLVTAYGTNTLFRNRGDGTFEDRSVQSGVAGPIGFWTGASWGDYDRDGWIDVYVTGYVRFVDELVGKSSLQYDVESPVGINPSSFMPERNLLYHNLGDGTFEEVSKWLGVDNPDGRSLSAVWADFDEDGWPDLYVANDVSDNALYRNVSGKVFEDISHMSLVADYRGAMGLAVGDWDGDVDFDLFITHWIAQENALYSNRIRTVSGERSGVAGGTLLRFIDEADRVGLGQIALDFVGWGTFFFDYDNDGRPDIFVANGSTLQQSERPEELIPMTDMLFWNGGIEEGFFDASASSGPVFQQTQVGRGAAYADFDNDGDLDFIISNHGSNAQLYANTGHPDNRWLAVRLRGDRSNREGVGARIRVVAGEEVYVQEVGSQSSYLSQNSLVAHFGLGASTIVDSVEVRWPSGLTSLHTGIKSNQMITLDESAQDS